MKTDREKLVAALARLKPALKSGGVLIELSHIWFAGKDAFAFDGDLGVRVPLDSGLECGVPGDVLLGLLGTSGLPAAQLDVAENALTVRLGRSTSKLSSLGIDRGMWPFPVRSVKKGEDSAEITKGLLQAVERVLVVEAKAVVARVEHKGVLVYRGKKKGAVLCATDSASIALARTSADLGADTGALILPYAFAERVVRGCEAGDTLVTHPQYLAASSAEATFFHRVVDAEDAQDVRAIIEKLAAAHPPPVPIPQPGLAIALERATILDGKEDAVVDVAIDDEGVRVRGKYKFGELDERISLKDGQHPAARGNFVAKLLLRGLKGPASATMSLDDQAIILRDDADSFMYAVAQRRA